MMQGIFIRIILIVLLGLEIYFFVKQKDKYKLLNNNVFWICASWMICLILYYFSGIKYTIKLDIFAFTYIILFWVIFLLGQYIIQKKGNNTEVEEGKLDFSKKINLFPLFVTALISVIIYTIYILVINDINFGSTRDIETNGIATILQVISSSSLIIWLYELSYSLLNDKRITIWGVISVIIFNVPGFIISGRDALIICMVSTFITFLYCGIYAKKVLKKESKVFKIAIKMFIVAIVIVLLYLIFLTQNRYGQNENSAINMFSWSAGAQFPEYLKWIYKYLGGFGKLIINVIFYYSSQLSKFALIFNEYDGPYLFGMYQLHYISRLLPESWNLNYTLVSKELQQITTNVGVPGIKVFWETAIGYSIYDFGRIGTLIISFLCGLIAGKVNDYTKKQENILEILIRDLMCTAMFVTVELSPLFDYAYIFPLFWLIVIYIYNKKRTQIGR